MKWADVRRAYPDQWLLIEALEAHTTPDGCRELDRIGVLEQCKDASDAFDCYSRVHDQFPHRELYYVQTRREVLDIREKTRSALRAKRQAYVSR